MEEVTQDTATLALLMEREIDKRVVMALMRMIDPTEDPQIHKVNMKMAEQAIDSGDRVRIYKMMSGLIVNVLLRDGCLLHEVMHEVKDRLDTKVPDKFY